MKNTNNCKMNQLPVSERPYEKCLEQGPAALSSTELLSVILKTGTREESAQQLASRLLSVYSGDHPLSDIFSAAADELSEIKGIGPVKAITLQCVGELSRRLSAEKTRNRIVMTTPSSLAGHYMERLRHLPHEEIWGVFFDSKGGLIRDYLISRGTANASLITPRELFIHALRNKAVFAAVVHNHPSGDPTPSDDDVKVTRQMSRAGSIINIPLFDHIVIGDGVYCSMREKHLI